MWEGCFITAPQFQKMAGMVRRLKRGESHTGEKSNQRILLLISSGIKNYRKYMRAHFNTYFYMSTLRETDYIKAQFDT